MDARVGLFYFDKDTSKKEILSYIDSLNLSVADNFIDYDAEAQLDKERYGETFTSLNVYFNQKGIEKILNSTDGQVLAARDFTNSKIINHQYRLSRDLLIEIDEGFLHAKSKKLFIDGPIDLKVSRRTCDKVKRHIRDIRKTSDYKEKRKIFLSLVKDSAKRLGAIRLLIQLAGIENVYIKGSVEGEYMSQNLYSDLGDPENSEKKVRTVNAWDN